MMNLQKFTNLIELLTYFKNEQVCRNYLEKMRWSGQIICPYCKHDKVFKYSNGKTYCCAECNKQFSVRVGTIFENSKVSLKKWITAIYLITSHKKGISSIQLHKDIGVTQKTAWFMLHRIRYTFGLNKSTDKLSGICEADETYIGGLEKNKHKDKKVNGTQGRSVKTKIAVAGIVERGGELRAQVVGNTSSKMLKPFIIENLEPESRINTDEWLGYKGLKKIFDHRIVKHNQKQYVNGDVYTNTMEGFWALLKRGITGIYHSMSRKHIQQYVDEFVFRYNTKDYNENYRFNVMLNNIDGRLTYKKLINIF